MPFGGPVLTGRRFDVCASATAHIHATATTVSISLFIDLLPPKYFAIVLCAGFFVASETKIINNAETSTIGTTGMNLKMLVPPGVRARTSVPPSDQKIVGGPGAGAGTTA